MPFKPPERKARCSLDRGREQANAQPLNSTKIFNDAGLVVMPTTVSVGVIPHKKP